MTDAERITRALTGEFVGNVAPLLAAEVARLRRIEDAVATYASEVEAQADGLFRNRRGEELMSEAATLKIAGARLRSICDGIGKPYLPDQWPESARAAQAAIEEVACLRTMLDGASAGRDTWQAYEIQRLWDGIDSLRTYNLDVATECERLRALNESLARRLAGASEALGRAAERHGFTPAAVAEIMGRLETKESST